MRQVLAFTLGVDHPSSRMRIEAYAAAWARAGWQLRMHAFDPGMGKSGAPEEGWWARAGRRARRVWRTKRATAALGGFDRRLPIVISRELPVRREPFLRSAHPLVLDLDDAVYLGGERREFDALCRRAAVVVCGNEVIAEEVGGGDGAARKCVVIPTVVDVAAYAVRTDYRLAGPLRVGWMGSSMSIAQTLEPVAEMLRNLRRELAFELVVISDERPGFLRDAPWVRFVKWSQEVERAVGSHMDIGIMPLEDNRYQAAKCGAKLLQYMAGGLPVVASPVGVNRQIVSAGESGYLAGNPEEWRAGLRRLAEDESLRASFGSSGRKRVADHYSVARWAGAWVELLESIAPGSGT